MLGSFDDAIQAKVVVQTSKEADSIIKGSLRRLEQDGIDLSKLSSMETAKLEKILAESMASEINGLANSTSYQWGYKSGKVFVKGDVGHFSFEKELAITDIAKSILVGTVTASGYQYGWKNKKFKRVHTCIGSFCLDISENPQEVIEHEQVAKQSIETPIISPISQGIKECSPIRTARGVRKC